jgi:hypothetical protein
MHLFRKLKKEKRDIQKERDELIKLAAEREEKITRWNESFFDTGFVLEEVSKENFYVEKSSTFYYISDFLSEEQVGWIDFIIKNQEKDRWVKLHHSDRRLQKWGKIEFY